MMEEAVARHAEAVHYSTSAGIWVGSDEGEKTKDSGFRLLVLEGLAGIQLRKEEADRVEKRIREVTEWDDPVEEKTGFVEAACQNYKVLVEDKRAGKARGVGPSYRYDTRSGQKQNDTGTTGIPNKTKKPVTG